MALAGGFGKIHVYCLSSMHIHACHVTLFICLLTPSGKSDRLVHGGHDLGCGFEHLAFLMKCLAVGSQ